MNQLADYSTYFPVQKICESCRYSEELLLHPNSQSPVRSTCYFCGAPVMVWFEERRNIESGNGKTS